MLVSNFILQSRSLFGSGDSRTSWQWQPNLTAHDPNPPITLENPATGSYTITASVGSFTLVGNSAILKAARLLSAALGTYSVSGVAAELKAARKLTAALGTYSIATIDAELRKTKILVGSAGTYAVSGTTSNLLAARKLTAASGSYIVVGNNVDLIYTPSTPASATGHFNTRWKASTHFVIVD